MTGRLYVLLLAIVVSVAPSSSLGAQSSTQFVDAIDLFALNIVSDARLSPDGSRVAFCVRSPLKEGAPDERRTRIHVVSVAGAARYVIDAEGHDVQSPRWSPDGKSVAYLSAQQGENDIWVIPAIGGPKRKIVDARTPVSAFAWSPDGRQIAYVSADPVGPAVAERQKLVQVSSDAVPVARLWVAQVDPPSAAVPLTSPSLHVLGSPSWSPDGSTIAFNHAPPPYTEGELETEVSVVYPSTRERLPIRKMGLSSATAIFSPDGQWIVVRTDVAGPEGPPPAIYAMSVDGQREKWVTAADHLTELGGWTADGRGVIVVKQAGTMRRVLRYLIEDGSPEILYDGPLLITELATGASHTMTAFVGESLAGPPEIYVSSLDKFAPAAVSSLNRDFSLPRFGETELIRWESFDGAVIEGLLTHPINHAEGVPVPLLVVAHSGGETFIQGFVANPFAGSSQIFPPPVFSSRGYAVLRVNQRGGGLGGYGFDASVPIFKPETRANRDILAGIDFLISERIADRDRVAVVGWSNGGLVAASLISTTDRFAAAAIIAGFPYLTLQSGINPWVSRDLGAAPWERLETYRDHAPEFALNGIRTPTLILHGESDTWVPVAHARALHGSLTRLGVATELAVYPGMGHAPTRPTQMIDIAQRTLGWFERHLPRRYGESIDSRD